MDELIRKAQKGESDSFVALFEHHKQGLWRTALAVLGNDTDSSDALQETALRAWRAIPAFAGRSSIGTWLTRILLHNCFDILERRKQESPVPSDLIAEKETEGNDRSSSADARVLVGDRFACNSDDALDVQRALQVLSEDDRVLLTLFYLNDYSVKQIAALLDLKEGAVKTRLSRARDRFRHVYEESPSTESEVVG